MTRDVVGACPLDCPDGCSWVVTVDERGKAVRLRGNSDHPFTAGGLCKKVNPWLEFAADPSRLTTPLRRTGAKGSGTFEPVAWDDALAEIAARLIEARDTHGGESIWPYAGTGSMGFVQGSGLPPGARLYRSLGASKHGATICTVSGHVGLGYSMGSSTGMDPEDVALSGTILLWGTNTLVANQHLWPFIETARGNGATVVVIDPVRTRTAKRADIHLSPLPGTDAALALGLCRELFARDVVDHEYLDKQTHGAAAFRESVQRWTPETTAAECGIDPSDILRLASVIEQSAPLAVKLGQGMQRHANGGQAARIVSCLPALMGSFNVRGGGLFYATGHVYRMNTAMPDTMIEPPGVQRSLAMTNLVHNLEQLDDPPVKVLMMTSANPVVSNPDTDGVRRALQRKDLFTVATDIYHTETTAFADIVLPSTMQHEQFEMNDSFSHLYLHWNEKAVEPPGECRSHAKIFSGIAAALGRWDSSFSDPLYQHDELQLAAHLLDTPEFAGAGVTVESLRRSGFVRLPHTAAPYLPFKDRFDTPSDKFEFSSSRAEADGFGLLPEYRSAKELHSDAPFMLVAGGSDWHVNSTFAGTQKTLGRASAPPVTVHPTDAAAHSLDDGAMVEVHNERGAFKAQLVVSDQGTRPGVAATSKGWWNQNVNSTVREEDSDMGRGAVYHDNAVWIRPVA